MAKTSLKRTVTGKTAAASGATSRLWRLRAFVRRHSIVVAVVVLFAVAGTVYLAYSRAATPAPGSIYLAAGGRCLDNRGNVAANSNPVQLYACGGGAGQHWTMYADGTLRVEGYCLDIKRAGMNPSTPVQIYTCNNGVNQRWYWRGHAIVSRLNGLCLDNKRNVNGNGNPIQIYTCNGGGNQQWIDANSVAGSGGNSGGASGGVSVAPSSGGATTTHPSDTAHRLFYEGFENGNLKQWNNQSCPTGVTIVTSPVRKGGHSAKFTVADGDTNARCGNVPTENPRAQIVADGLFHNGDERWISQSIYFPTGFPKDVKSWFQLLELYGAPFGGSPPNGFDICNTKLCWSRGARYGYDHVWEDSGPIITNQWYDMVYHVKFSTDANTGFVEIYKNGVIQKLKNGQTRINYPTLDPGVNWNGTPNGLFLNQYRASGTGLGTVTLYQDEAAVGTTYNSVAP